MPIEMISTAEAIVVTTTMIKVRDDLLSFPAKSGTLLLLRHSKCLISEQRRKNIKLKAKITYKIAHLYYLFLILNYFK